MSNEESELMGTGNISKVIQGKEAEVVKELARLSATLFPLTREYDGFYGGLIDPLNPHSDDIAAATMKKIDTYGRLLRQGQLDSPGLIPVFWGVISNDENSRNFDNYRLFQSLYGSLASLAGHQNSVVFSHDREGLVASARYSFSDGQAVERYDSHLLTSGDHLALTEAGELVGYLFKLSPHLYAEFTDRSLSTRRQADMAEVNIWVVPEETERQLIPKLDATNKQQLSK